MSDAAQVSTISDEVGRIHRKWATFDGLCKRGVDLRLSLAMDLRDLKRRVENGEDGDEAALEWWDWYRAHFQRSEDDAKELLRIAAKSDPQAALDHRRAQKAASQQASRDKQKLRVVDNNTFEKPVHVDSPSEPRVVALVPKRVIKAPVLYPSKPDDDQRIARIMAEWDELSWDGRVRLWDLMEARYAQWHKGEV